MVVASMKNNFNKHSYSAIKYNKYYIFYILYYKIINDEEEEDDCRQHLEQFCAPGRTACGRASIEN